jgi:BASS family bile acid:Na+ symporter
MIDGDAIQDVAVQALNISLMFSLGLELDRGRLVQAAKRWGLLSGVTALNFLVVPAIAFALRHWLPIEASVGAGLLLAAVAPGGGTGTLLTRLARGNLELSVILLGIFTALAVPIVPALALFALGDGETTISLGGMLRTLLVFQLLPLAVGMGVRAAKDTWAATANRVAKPVSNVIFGGLVVGLLATRGHLTVQVGAMGLVAIVGTVIPSLGLAALIPAGRSDRAALALTTAVRNLSLALLISTSFFDDLTTITVLTYGLVMYLATVPVALWLRRSDAT